MESMQYDKGIALYKRDIIAHHYFEVVKSGGL